MASHAAGGAFLLESILTRQTKAELMQLCRKLQIKGVSGLRKSRLVAYLRQRLPAVIAGKMLCWDQSIYSLVQEITTLTQIHRLEAEGSSPAEDYLLEEYVGFPETYGDHLYLIIPLEIQELFFALDGPAYRRKVRENTEIARLTRGLLHYYGCLPLHELGKMLNRLLPEPVDVASIGEVLREIGFYSWNIVFERGYFCDGRLTDLDYLLAALRERRALEYRPLSYAEAWQAGEASFYHRNMRQIREVASFLHKHQLEEEAPYFLDLLFSLVQTDLSPPEIVYALLEHMERATDEDITELALVVFDFYHCVPHWVLKGHSPEEIMERATRPDPPREDRLKRKAIVYDFATRKRLSPDAPCPCGSQLDYGHC